MNSGVFLSSIILIFVSSVLPTIATLANQKLPESNTRAISAQILF